MIESIPGYEDLDLKDDDIVLIKMSRAKEEADAAEADRKRREKEDADLLEAKLFLDNCNQIPDEDNFKDGIKFGIAKDIGIKKPEIDGSKVFDAKWLTDQELKPVEFIVEDFLPVGLNIIVAPPKFGKSYFVLDLCLAVAQGKRFLGHKTKKSDCLYLALEDSQNRLQSRILQLEEKCNVPEGLKMATKINNLANGFRSDIEAILKQHPDIKLIVVDTLQLIRGGSSGREGAYSGDYREMAQIKAISMEKNVSILLVHHDKKESNPDDPFANISGTNGIAGSMDTMFVLSKEKRMDDQAFLHITGRDVEQSALVMEQKDFHWRIVGSVDDVAEIQLRESYNSDPIVKTIKALVKASPESEWKGTASEFIKEAEKLGNYIRESVRNIGKQFKHFDPSLFENDRIFYNYIKNGSGAGYHQFTNVSTVDDR